MSQTLSASEAAAAIRSSNLTSVDLVQRCIARIEALEDTVRAWTFFDPAHALHQAHEADRLHCANAPLGPLHGVPVGIKDIFDTSDMPTENGTGHCHVWTPLADQGLFLALRGSWVRSCLRPSFAENRIRWP